jgi:hypothetical protein
MTVTGTVILRLPGARQLVMETGTAHKYKVLLTFTPMQYARVPEAKVLEVIGVCAGPTTRKDGSYVTLENCEPHDAKKLDYRVRITPEYFPLDPERIGVYDLLSPQGATAKEHPLARYSIRFVEPDLIKSTVIRLGTYPKATLFEEPAQPKWKKDLTNPSPKQKVIPEINQVRHSEAGLEARPKPPPPALPGPWWEPVLKFGAKKGDTWSSTMPDGRVSEYKVMDFSTDAVGRPTVEILRVQRNPKDTKETTREETTIVYTYRVGEVRRQTVMRASTGHGVVIFEARLVESESTGLPELKTRPDPKKESDPFKTELKSEK